MFSIIIPSFNNIDYLKICINSLKRNSFFDNEIIVHLNISSDKSNEFLETQKIKFTHIDLVGSTSNLIKKTGIYVS